MRSALYLPKFLAVSLIYAATIPAYADNDDRKKCDSDKLKFSNITLPLGADVLQPTAANSSGWITGYYRDTPGMLKGFLLRGKRYSDVSFPNTASYTIEASFPVGITQRGLVAGVAFEAAGPAHSYTRMGNSVTELIYPGSQTGTTFIRSMSSDGKILGESVDGQTGLPVLFVYKDGVYTPLSLPANPPATDIYWASINSSGHLLGAGDNASGRVLLVAKRNHYKVLPTIPGNLYNVPISLLDSGEVIVDSSDLDLPADPEYGANWFGNILRKGKWQQIRAPKDTKRITHLTGAAMLNNDNLLLLGTYATNASYILSPFKATERDCDND